MANDKNVKATGGCLCGAVRYKITGNLRDVVNCHCSKCRRFHGSFGAYTSVKEKELTVLEPNELKWYWSTTDETPDVYRGFCSTCGSSLFWHPKNYENVAVSAGSLDEPTRLKTIGHIWLSQISDYYTISDELPKYQEGWES